MHTRELNFECHGRSSSEQAVRDTSLRSLKKKCSASSLAAQPTYTLCGPPPPIACLREIPRPCSLKTALPFGTPHLPPLTIAREEAALMEEEALREAMEDAFLEGAAQWRADNILQTLQMDKLDAWIRQEGLGGDIEALKSEIDEVMATVSYVKGRAVGNRRLARSLAAIKQKLFDADDAVDEHDYYRLQQQVELEGGNLIHRNGFYFKFQ